MPFRIRTKLTVAFVGIILFIISVVGVIAYYSQKALFRSLHMVGYAYTEREYFSDIRIAVEKTVMAANDYLITGERKEREVFGRSAAEAERLFRKIPYENICKRCHPAAKGIVDRFNAIKLAEEMKYIKELSESFARIRSKGEEIFAIDRPVGSAAGARLMEEMDALYHAETARIITSYRGTIRGRVSEAIAAAQGVRGRSWLIMLLASVILASIGLIFSSLYARSFVLPIEIMHERADAIARGDFKARVEISSRDELGQLAGAMNEMAEKLDSFYGTLEEQVEERTRDLKSEKDLAQTYLDIAGIMFVTIDSNEKVTLVNKKGAEILGCPESEIIGKNWFDEFLPEKVRGEIRGVFGKLIRGEDDSVEYVENPVLTMRGEEKLIAWHNTVLKDDAGKIIATLSSGEDITERKKADEALKEREERYRRLIESVTDYIFTVKVESGRPVSCTHGPGSVAITGYTSEEYERNPDLWLQMVYGGDREAVLRQAEAVLSGKAEPIEHRIITKDGRIRWVRNVPVPLYDQQGRLIAYDGLISDITRRKEAEETLTESEERFRAVSETAGDAIICLAAPDRITLWNSKAEEMFGYTAASVIGSDLHRLIVPERHREKAVKGLANFFETGEGPIVGKTIEIEAQRKDGSEFPIELSISAMKIREKWQATGIIRDITERKKAAEELAKHVNELERYMKATVQREFRIKELRDRVEELEKKLKG